MRYRRQCHSRSIGTVVIHGGLIVRSQFICGLNRALPSRPRTQVLNESEGFESGIVSVQGLDGAEVSRAGR